MLNLGLLLCKFEGCRPGPGIPGPSQAVILSTSGRFLVSADFMQYGVKLCTSAE